MGKDVRWVQRPIQPSAWWVRSVGVKGGVGEGEVEIRLGCWLGRGPVVKGLECLSEEFGFCLERVGSIHSFIHSFI